MARLAADTIRTREVLDWKGIHLFHYPMSSCSQKTRIALRLKGVDWTPHLVDLSRAENNGEVFLGINPRGLVPVLVIDGAVHIESNDILLLLDEMFPEPRLFPPGQKAEIVRRLAAEDDLHIDLRTLSFRFCYGRTRSTKPAEALEAYRRHGGAADPRKQKEIDFYDRIARDGLSDAMVRAAAARFRLAFADWNERLAGGPYLLGATLTALDIAWYVYAKRLALAGYPLARLHPRVADWFGRLDGQPDFEAGLAIPPETTALIAANRRTQQESGTTLAAVAGLH